MNRRAVPLSWLVAGSLLIAASFMLMPLPDWLAFARPALLPLVTLYWVLQMPRRFGLLAGWCLGLLLDVMFGTVLGQHALALVLCCFLVAKFGEFIRSYRLWQQAMLFLPIFLVYEFVLFWLDGLTGRSFDPIWRFAPVVSSALSWPVIAILFGRFTRYTEPG
jgi:rod shape-determining protein MreD